MNSNNILPEYDSLSIYPNTKTLSSSQVIDYYKDPQVFYMKHVMGVKGEPSMPMKNGRVFSALYQNRDLDFKSIMTEMGSSPRIISLFERSIKKFPVLDGGYPEYPLIADLNGWSIRATLDDFVEHRGIIIENKTGMTVWTKDRVDNDLQVSIQAWCYWKKKGVPPKQIILNWLNTTPNARRELQSFKTSRTIKQLRDTEKILATIISNIEVGNYTQNIQQTIETYAE